MGIQKRKSVKNANVLLTDFNVPFNVPVLSSSG